MEDELLLSCGAGDHVLGLGLDADEHLIYLSIYVGEFYAKQRSFAGRWLERLKMAAIMLLGREYMFEDVVLNRAEAGRMADFLATLAQSKEAP